MTIALLVALLLTVVVLVVVVVRSNRGPVAGGDSLSPEQFSAVVSHEVTKMLTTLSEQARADRDESIRIARETVTQTGEAAFGQKAQDINSTLDAYRKSLDTQISELRKELTTLRETNARAYGDVNSIVTGLAQETQALNKVLSNSQKRGNWGERMLEDILAESGFTRGINYERQETLTEGGRPDYSFYLPPDRVLYLDSKFPLDNYVSYFEATDDQARVTYRDAFLKNVEQRIKELEKRDYVSQSNRQALDYVLLFIPNESILGFIQQERPSLIDDATSRKVVLCSPLTLYTFLGVARQATDSFHMEQNANEVLSIFDAVGKSWERYTKEISKIDKAFKSVTELFRVVSPDGAAFKNLAKQFKKVDHLIEEKGITSTSDSSLDDDLTLLLGEEDQ